MNKIIYAVFLLAVIFTSCKKDKNGTTVNSDKDNDIHGGLGTTNASQLDLLKDSVYGYAREEYLWYDALPPAT